jgi:LacI family transcriptional regulator
VATVADVAVAAGVSVSTAARVLSGSGYASEGTRRAVLDAARELGYVPNQIARSLRTKQTRLVGLLIGDVENAFYSVIARNVESATREAGYHVVLCNSDDDPESEREYLELLEGMRVDALIVTPTSKNRRQLARLIAKGIVVVQVDRRIEGLQADAVLVDNEDGAASAVTHLVEAGHTRVGILTGELEVSTASQRLAGYERALTEHGIAIEPSLVRSGSFHREHAIEDATALIGAEPAPTAIFAANNILAEATLIALDQRRLRVPRDVSVVAFDDMQWMAMVEPPLTTVRQPVADLARSAAELALRRLRDGFEGGPSTVTFHTELIERGSVASPRKPARPAKGAAAS